MSAGGAPAEPGEATTPARRRLGAAWPLLAVLLYLLLLAVRPLILPDEFRYAEISREMLVSGDWVVPRFDGLPYFEKPALGYWWIAASQAAFGLNRFAVRLPSALAMGLTALLVAFLLRRGAGRRGVAASWLGALVFLTSLLVMGISTAAVLDGPLTLFLTAALAAFFLATEAPPGSARERGWLLATGVACGCAFLTKGFLAFVVPALTGGGYLAVQRRWRDLLRMPWLPAVATAVVAAPWSLLVHQRAPEFWPYFFWHEHVERFFSSQQGQHPEPWWFFLASTPVLLLPWTCLLPAAVRGLRREPDPGSRHLVVYCAVWVAVTLLFFSASSGKLMTYVLPAFPALAMLVALGVEPWLGQDGERPLRAGAWAGAGFFALLTVAGVVFLVRQHGSQMLTQWRSALLVLCLAQAAATLTLAARLPVRRRSLLLVAGTLLPLLVAAQAALPEPVLESRAPGAFFASHREAVTPATVLLADRNTLRAATWIFRRDDVVVVGSPGELQFGVEHSPEAGRSVDFEQARALIAANAGAVVLVIEASKYRRWRAELPPPRQVTTQGDEGFVVVHY